MRFTLVAAALAVAVAVPAAAEAQRPGGAAFTAGSNAGRGNVTIHRGGDSFTRDDHRRDRRDVGGDIYFPYREYQGDTLWRPESFNDWWHERPNRSYPAWVARNNRCERLWWSGGGWRC